MFVQEKLHLYSRREGDDGIISREDEDWTDLWAKLYIYVIVDSWGRCKSYQIVLVEQGGDNEGSHAVKIEKRSRI